MDSETLYIVGNGFDIYHGIPSTYSDFKQYILTSDRELYDIVQKYIPLSENWSDLEITLADLDVDNLLDTATQFLEPYDATPWSDAYHHDYQNFIDNNVKALSEALKSRLGEWVRQLEIPSIEDLLVFPLKIPPSARYLTFNYTSTLNEIYRIPSANTLHIHGEAKKKERLALGHGRIPVKIPSLNKDIDDDTDPRVIEGNDIINSYFGYTFKDTQSKILENINFFESLEDILKITVLGHSISQIDLAYFKEIVSKIDLHRVRWIVTYYGDHERERHRNSLIDIGVPENVISFCRMSELQNPDQLRLPI